MDLNLYHNLNTLFAQLGLPDDDESIYRFIEAHKPLPLDVEIADAPWWLPAQAEFLREEIIEDSDWAIVIDELNELLRS